jgi:hypothetical protein
MSKESKAVLIECEEDAGIGEITTGHMKGG